MEIETLIKKLKLPSPTELIPWLVKLIANSDSLVIIAIEKPLLQEGPHVTWAWLSAKERLQVRKALIAIRKSREDKGESQTTEIPK
jgi:hypothetical protein